MKKLGVIVARFQTHRLHSGHRALIDQAFSECDHVAFFLGESRKGMSVKNPLTFEERAHILNRYLSDGTMRFNNHSIYKIMDESSDMTWSGSLDGAISRICMDDGFSSVVLFSGRDGFSKNYTGIYEVKEVFNDCGESATKMRQEILDDVFGLSGRCCEDVMYGRLTALAAQFPTVYSTVDILLMREEDDHVLLGKKRGEPFWRMPGGFVDPSDESFIDAARRELSEEVTGIKVSDWYLMLGNYKIDDWRYRDTPHRIFTNVFMIPYESGEPVAGDDLEEVAWFDFNLLDTVPIFSEHKRIIDDIKYRATEYDKVQG